MKGQWKKIGGYAYDWTAVGFPLDENAASLLIVKASETNILGEDCDSLIVTNIVMEVFPPFANVYSDTPILDHPGFRIKMDLTELLP